MEIKTRSLHSKWDERSTKYFIDSHLFENYVYYTILLQTVVFTSTTLWNDCSLSSAFFMSFINYRNVHSVHQHGMYKKKILPILNGLGAVVVWCMSRWSNINYKHRPMTVKFVLPKKIHIVLVLLKFLID